MKKLLCIFLVATLLFSFGSFAFADNGQDIINENEYGVRYVPYDYWPDGEHRWQDGNTSMKYEDTGTNERRYIYEDGHEIGYKVYKEQNIYKITEQYCACGMTRTKTTKTGTRWIYSHTVKY